MLEAEAIVFAAQPMVSSWQRASQTAVQDSCHRDHQSRTGVDNTVVVANLLKWSLTAAQLFLLAEVGYQYAAQQPIIQ